MHVYVLSHFSCVWLFETQWTITRQAPCSYVSPGKNTGVGCHFLLQGVFLTQGSNSQLLHCRQSFYQLGHQDPCKPCAGHRVWVLLQVNLSRHPLPSALAFLPLLDCTGHQERSGIFWQAAAHFGTVYSWILLLTFWNILLQHKNVFFIYGIFCWVKVW